MVNCAFKGKIHLPLSPPRHLSSLSCFPNDGANINMANNPSRKRTQEEANLSTNQTSASEREYILNADGTVLHDHKGVSFCEGRRTVFYVRFRFLVSDRF